MNPADNLQDRRVVDQMWKDSIAASVKSLQDNQTGIQQALVRNNEMTEALLVIFNGTKTFWSFCTKTSKILLYIAKKGTIIALAVTAFYHAADAILHHDLISLLKGLLKK